MRISTTSRPTLPASHTLDIRPDHRRTGIVALGIVLCMISLGCERKTRESLAVLPLGTEPSKLVEASSGLLKDTLDQALLRIGGYNQANCAGVLLIFTKSRVIEGYEWIADSSAGWIYPLRREHGNVYSRPPATLTEATRVFRSLVAVAGEPSEQKHAMDTWVASWADSLQFKFQGASGRLSIVKRHRTIDPELQYLEINQMPFLIDSSWRQLPILTHISRDQIKKNGLDQVEAPLGLKYFSYGFESHLTLWGIPGITSYHIDSTGLVRLIRWEPEMRMPADIIESRIRSIFIQALGPPTAENAYGACWYDKQVGRCIAREPSGLVTLIVTDRTLKD